MVFVVSRSRGLGALLCVFFYCKVFGHTHTYRAIASPPRAQGSALGSNMETAGASSSISRLGQGGPHTYIGLHLSTAINLRLKYTGTHFMEKIKAHMILIRFCQATMRHAFSSPQLAPHTRRTSSQILPAQLFFVMFCDVSFFFL